MGFFSDSLRNKILTIATTALLLLSAVAIVEISILSSNVEQYDYLIDEVVDDQRKADDLSVAFKTQVQEWKNVLLRGHNANDRDKYWNRFLEKQQQIQSGAKSLRNEVISPEARSVLSDFITSHNQLASQYQKGYDAFVNNNFDHKLGDQTVRGIDREPSQQIQKVAEIISQQVARLSNETREGSKTATTVSIPIIIVLAIILIISLFYLMNSQFKKPVEELLDIIHRFGEGDFSGQIQSNRTDELGQMRKQLANTQNFLRSLMGQVKSTSSQLNKDADTVSRASAEIAHGTQTTSSRIEQTATAVTQMTSTVQEVAHNANGAAESASRADNSAQSGRSVMQNTIQTINALSQEVTKASTVIQKLEEDTNSVGTVLDVIRGIAEQTNLLALNAAIEAARAGEQGRGFAVVADEVRNLAQRTQESTAEIQQIIENVQTGAKDAVTAMEQGRESTTACVEQANQAGASLDEITGAVNEIHMMNTQIATAAEEQTTVAEDISQNVNEISQSTSEIHENVRKFNQLSSSLAEMADELTSITQQVKV